MESGCEIDRDGSGEIHGSGARVHDGAADGRGDADGPAVARVDDGECGECEHARDEGEREGSDRGALHGAGREGEGAELADGDEVDDVEGGAAAADDHPQRGLVRCRDDERGEAQAKVKLGGELEIHKNTDRTVMITVFCVVVAVLVLVILVLVLMLRKSKKQLDIERGVVPETEAESSSSEYSYSSSSVDSDSE